MPDYDQSSPLSLADVARLPTDILKPLISRDFQALATVAIADATSRDIPTSTRRLLRTRTWHLAWRDALLFAEGELQVSTEIMAAEGNSRLDANLQRLAKVRVALQAANRRANEVRRADARDSLRKNGFYYTNMTARSLLMRAHPEDLPQPDSSSTPSADKFDAIENGFTRGWLAIPSTDEVDHLLQSNDLEFMDTVADDARDQRHRVAALRHPLLLRRWDQGLKQLAQATYPLAGAPSEKVLGPLPEGSNELSEAQRSALFRARRFLAAIQQRQAECIYQTRWASDAVQRRKDEDPQVIAVRQAYAAAGDSLAAKYPEEHAYILARLAPYEYRPGILNSETSIAKLQELRRQIVDELTSGSWRS